MYSLSVGRPHGESYRRGGGPLKALEPPPSCEVPAPSTFWEAVVAHGAREILRVGGVAALDAARCAMASRCRAWLTMERGSQADSNCPFLKKTLSFNPMKGDRLSA